MVVSRYATWFVQALVFAGVLVAIGVLVLREEEEEGEMRAAAALGARGTGRVELSPGAVQSLGLAAAPASPTTWVERVAIYGRVVPNPKAAAEVRAAFAGTLQSGDRGWPQLGQAVRAGEAVGALEVRVGPQERLDLEARLREARLRHEGALEVEKVQRDRVDRLQKLTASDIVSKREIAEALVALTEAEIEVSTTNSTLDLLAAALAQINSRNEPVSRWRLPVLAPGEGEVAQVFTRPGAAVEAGALLLKVVNFRQLLVRMDIPPATLAGLPPVALQVRADLDADSAASGDSSPVGDPGLAARLAGTTPQVDVVSQMSSYWYEATAPEPFSARWRPGLFVVALVPRADTAPRPALAVPTSAVVYHEGQPWVYVETAPGSYQRRGLTLTARDGQRWIVASGIQPDERIVAGHTQALLAEEFRTAGDDDD